MRGRTDDGVTDGATSIGGRRVLIAVGVVALAAIALSHLRVWFETGNHQLFGTDFGLFYAFARIGLNHGFAHLYDLHDQRAIYASIGPLSWFRLPYPPLVAFVVAPLTILPLSAAYWVWSTLLALALVVTAAILAPRRAWPWSAVVLLGVFLWPQPLVFALALGQFVIFQMLGVAASWWFVRRGRETAAGLALAPVALHPQGLFLLPFVLLLAGQRKLFGAWALSILVLGLLCLVVVGPTGASGFLHRLKDVSEHPAAFAADFRYIAPAWLADLGIPGVFTELAVVAVALAGGWRLRNSPVEVPFAVGIVGSLLCTSFLHAGLRLSQRHRFGF